MMEFEEERLECLNCDGIGKIVEIGVGFELARHCHECDGLGSLQLDLLELETEDD